MLVHTAFFLAAVFLRSTARCPKYHPATELLQESSGSFSYEDYFQTKRWCQWSFPAFKVIDHVILLKLTSVSMYKSGCLGSLRLTGLSSFCVKPTNSCFIYSSQPSCNREMTFDLIRKENCSNTYWVFDDVTHRNIRFLSTRRGQKSFTFEYKYFSCKTGFTSKSAVTSNTSDDDAMQNFTRAENGTLKLMNSGVPPGTFAGVIVLLILLLAACLALMILLYRRLRRLKSGSRVPRVQYELATSRDITVLQLSQTEQNVVPTNGNSSFALHGEHHHDRHQNDAIHLQENPASSHNYSVDANYGNDTTRSYDSFTSDESEHSGPENTAIEYATINKRRAPTSG